MFFNQIGSAMPQGPMTTLPNQPLPPQQMDHATLINLLAKVIAAKQGRSDVPQDSSWLSGLLTHDLMKQSTQVGRDASMARLAESDIAPLIGGNAAVTEEQSLGRRYALAPPDIQGAGRTLIDDPFMWRSKPDNKGGKPQKEKK